jgi:hypothetical protein
MAATNTRTRVILAPKPYVRSPHLLVAWEGWKRDWWGSLQTICKRVYLDPFREASDLFLETPVRPFRFEGRPLSVSLLVHSVAILLLPLLLTYSRANDTPSYGAVEEPRTLYFYPIPEHDPLEKLPRITPSGDGSHPGAGAIQELLTRLGSTTPAKRIIVVSKPVRPDNNRQTIYQPATPPDLRINMDLKLPNVIGGTTAEVPKPQMHFTPNDSKPLQSRRTATQATAPTLAAGNAAMPTSLPDATVAKPHLAVPINESRPMQAQVVIGELTAPSLSAANTATATNLGDSFHTGQPNAPAAPSSDADSSGSGRTSKRDNVVQTAGDGSGIVVIGVDPAEAAALASLPPGNRWGDFTIAPGGGQPGATAGDPHWSPNSGSGSSGVGGDRSTGVGSGITGGGGGKSGNSGVVSITGGSSGTGEGMLDAAIIRDMVFAVPSTVVLRKNALVVSAGPMGGGGLDAYGALHCGKIYTVFIAMPGKSWTLQYCQSGHAPSTPTQTSSSVVRLEQGLVPPDAETRFDFKRLPVPFEKKNKPIVLKGVIKDDGTVNDLKIYQSIVPEMDQAARVAFGRFKFKPAMKDGKPVAVDILVGIPTEVQPSRSQ